MQIEKCKVNSDGAESMGTGALTYLASDSERFSRFLNVTGAEIATLKESSQSVEILASVIDYMLHDEALLVEWCAADGIDPASVIVARRRLPGFEEY